MPHQVTSVTRKDLPQLYTIKWSDDAAMIAIGTRIDEMCTLVRDGGAFYLLRDVGRRYKLELHRLPVDLVNADSVAPA